MKCFSCGFKLDKDYINCPNCYENLKESYEKYVASYIKSKSPKEKEAE